MNIRTFNFSTCIALSLGVLTVQFAQAMSSPTPARIATARHDVLPSLRDTPKSATRAPSPEHPVKPIPLAKRSHAPSRTDYALQTRTNRTLPVTSSKVYDGLDIDSDQGQYYPPDTNIAVGKTYYVEWVNTAFAVYRKIDGQRIYGPADGSQLWTGFGGNCEHFNDGDPIVQYDRLANRWLMTQFAVDGRPYSQCIAVSTTDDPLGSYARYEFQFADFNDYPKFGVWPDAYYATFNMFRDGSAFVGSDVCAFERAKMLLARAARAKCFFVPNLGGLLPSDFTGTLMPPLGSPNVFVNFGYNSLNIWKFHVDWKDATRSTFSGPAAVPVAPFTPACDRCIDQPNTSEKLDTLSDRLMYRLAYRRRGSTSVLVVNHTVSTGSGAGIRWYELHNADANPKVYQQGTYTPADGAARWLGSIATDRVGDMLLGYNASSDSTYPSIRFTGRMHSDPLDSLDGERVVFTGSRAQTGVSRWGDYNSVAVDPTDDCTFWFTSEYIENLRDGNPGWKTKVIAVRLAGCR